MATMLQGVATLKSKVISVSKGRQITIPLQFFEEVGMANEAECLVRDGEIVIRPVNRQSEFSELILRDLVARGLGGEELISEFLRVSSEIRPAAIRMLAEAHHAPQNIDRTVSPENKLTALFDETEE